MPARRHRLAVVENRVRRLLSLPELGRSVTVFAPPGIVSGGMAAPSVSGSAAVRAPKIVQLGVAVEHDIAMPITAVRRSGSAHTTVGFTSSAQGRRVWSGSTGREGAEEATWLATTTMFGGWVAELVVSTREAQALGALAGLAVGYRQWRAWRGR